MRAAKRSGSDRARPGLIINMAYTSDTDAFEIKRVMRQEAHEKAFEIKVQTQRLFEKEKNKIVKDGKHRIEKDISSKEMKTEQDLNI